jgi:hypothetical protein
VLSEPPTETTTTHPGIQVGAYTLFDAGDEHIGIFHTNGEGGLFQKKEFEAHVAAFFGLNF